ncbi:hypothetical protein WJX81_008576 [Elliptochloris bilobata]|uniref:Uncharacterized protein n=1 Tax=Elliptochloris bilobata TaxID=381761 RepID=A0AAW1S8K0_9CHLO
MHRFSHQVRVAVVDLDAPPRWWPQQAAEHMTATEARRFAGTDGPVHLLTNPVAASYVQNPISVYYCFAAGSDVHPAEASAARAGPAPSALEGYHSPAAYDRAPNGRSSGCSPAAGRLQRCIAEVTNTPWGARVTFAFEPGRQAVPKAMHVSPLMDMHSTWTLRAEAPGERLALAVSAAHPELGDFFSAKLRARRDARAARNERAGLATLLRYGYLPQRIALWIYWQAVVLLCKGARFFPYPDPHLSDFLLEAASQGNVVPWPRVHGNAPAAPPARIADPEAGEAQMAVSSEKAAEAVENRRARQKQLYAALRRMSTEGGHDRWVHSGIAAALASADPRATTRAESL